MSQQKIKGMLDPYRVLDLTDEKGWMCGKLLGDLGADVIKIEPPSGDPGRNIGPFYHDEPHPEKSLFWFAFNTSKRGITLDIETADGREAFKRLVKSADFVIESFAPGYMDKLGLGYPVLEKVNPRVIMVSITPFGQTGPYRDYKVSDIVAWALGGYMYPFGGTDRPPVRISHHSQAYLHAAAEAAVGAMMALYHREVTGEGQQVDVSVLESVAWNVESPVTQWDMLRVMAPRGRRLLNVRVPWTWPCKDGYVTWIFWTGQMGKRINPPLIKWMESEGMADDFLKEFDWEAWDLLTASQEVMDRITGPAGKFFMAHTTAELVEGALKRKVMIYPVSTSEDILEGGHSVQLAARGYWAKVEHPELGAVITYPGAFVKASETLVRVWRRAPLIGEHNQEVYEKELGISREELLTLKQAKVI